MTENAQANLTDFLDRTAAKEPTPGGGAAAALVGAAGAALGSMVLRYSIAKAPLLESTLDRLEGARSALQELIDADCEAYAAVSKAYALPRASDEEKEARRVAIRTACRVAMMTPLGGMVAATDALTALGQAIEQTNKNLQTDAATAAITLSAAVDSLGLFVLVNANALGADAETNGVRLHEAHLRELATRVSQEIRARVRSDLEKSAR